MNRQESLDAMIKVTREQLDDLAAFRRVMGIPEPRRSIWQRIVWMLEDARYDIRKARAELRRMARRCRR